MLFSCIANVKNRGAGDVLIVPVWSSNGSTKLAASLSDPCIKECIPLHNGDFSAELCKTIIVYSDQVQEQRIVFIGLGESELLSEEKIRSAYGVVTKLVRENKWEVVNLVLPTITQLKNMELEGFLSAIADGILSCNYTPKVYGSNKADKAKLLNKVQLIGVTEKLGMDLLKQRELVYGGVFVARDLINGNADEITPGYLASVALNLEKDFDKLSVEVFDENKIQDHEMGLLTAVSRGSKEKPRFIIMKYNGNGKSKDQTVLVGKGITYDTGGLDLKPGKSMLTMKEDMSGAAAVIGSMIAIASLNLKVNVTALIPATENSISSTAYKMGDVYIGASGDSVEICSTDAEGRLVLADALSYALSHCKPVRIIDFATLTGAMVVALGNRISGVFSNDDELYNSLLEAGSVTGDLLWRMPLVEAYRESLKSDIADLKNLGGKAGSITAALFLEHFVKKIPWAHIDIAGTAYQTEAQSDYWPKYGVGFGVRLIVAFLEKLSKG